MLLLEHAHIQDSGARVESLLPPRHAAPSMLPPQEQRFPLYGPVEESNRSVTNGVVV